MSTTITNARGKRAEVDRPANGRVRLRLNDRHGTKVTMLISKSEAEELGASLIAAAQEDRPLPGQYAEWDDDTRAGWDRASERARKAWATRRANGWTPGPRRHRGGPARLYLFVHREMGAIKVGITHAEHDSRLQSHRAWGWEQLGVVDFATRSEAKAEEHRIIKSWRDEGYPPALSPELVPQGGWTETAALNALSLVDTPGLLHAEDCSTNCSDNG